MVIASVAANDPALPGTPNTSFGSGGAGLKRSAQPLLIGALPSQGSTWDYNGVIGQVGVWNRRLSDGEVRLHFKRGRPAGA